MDFSVGPQAIKEFRMIERHFFRNKLLKSFDFDFGFCIPDSKNTVEHIYDFPQLDPETVRQMVASPFETKSDSFYFVDGKLIMHNKADYSYNNTKANWKLTPQNFCDEIAHTKEVLSSYYELVFSYSSPPNFTFTYPFNWYWTLGQKSDFTQKLHVEKSQL